MSGLRPCRALEQTQLPLISFAQRRTWITEQYERMFEKLVGPR